MSRPQVTITLGRSGQVVKRALPDSDVTHSDYVPPIESKIPIRDRLGSNADHSLYGGKLKNKRQRRTDVDDDRLYFSNAQVGQDDLRYKLMRKNLSRRAQSSGGANNGVDLRVKLTRTAQAPLKIDTRQRMPEPRRIPPTRSADDLLRIGSLRKSYSAWTLDGLRHRSPDRILGSSRGISSTRNVGEPAPPLRSMDASRSNPFMTEGSVDKSRPAAFMTRAPVAFRATKPVVQLPPPTGMMQKTMYMADEPLTVSGLLQSLGLGKYSILFKAEEVDMTALKQMGDNDLKELGIPMGPRKKILLAILARSKQRQS